jgi:hypothetical protein
MSLLLPKDVAKILGCSPPHVRYLMDAGLLQHVTIPGTTQRRRMRRVTPEMLDHFIETHKSEPCQRES